MRILPISDVHHELDRNVGKAKKRVIDTLPTDVDVLVLAGDVVKGKSIFLARQVLGAYAERFKRVVYVPGNHEYYNSTFDEADKHLRICESEIANLTVLRTGEVHTIDGKRFLGDTLWYPEPIGLYGMGFPGEEMTESRYNWSDFVCISGADPEIFRRNRQTREFLKAEVQPGDVVVTHMLPSWRSVHERWQGQSTNMYFVSDEAETIMTKEPALWLHGHTHEAADYVFHKTRVVCNPCGYPGEQQRSLRKDLIIEI